MVPYQTKKLLSKKRNNQQSEKATYRMKENIFIDLIRSEFSKYIT
jgi:hypothetical protein